MQAFDLNRNRSSTGGNDEKSAFYRLPDNTYNKGFRQINDAGQVVWEGEALGGYSATANAESATYGRRSFTGTGVFNQIALLLFPATAVLILRILRRKWLDQESRIMTCHPVVGE